MSWNLINVVKKPKTLFPYFQTFINYYRQMVMKTYELLYYLKPSLSVERLILFYRPINDPQKSNNTNVHFFIAKLINFLRLISIKNDVTYESFFHGHNRAFVKAISEEN